MTDRPGAEGARAPDGQQESPPAGAAADAAPRETEEAGISRDEEPVTTGTLFVMLLFLMALAGMWALMYMVLLER